MLTLPFRCPPATLRGLYMYKTAAIERTGDANNAASSTGFAERETVGGNAANASSDSEPSRQTLHPPHVYALEHCSLRRGASTTSTPTRPANEPARAQSSHGRSPAVRGRDDPPRHGPPVSPKGRRPGPRVRTTTSWRESPMKQTAQFIFRRSTI